MTYRAHLDHLLDIVIQKSLAYFNVGAEATEKIYPFGGLYSEKLKIAQQECEAGKTAYQTFLNFVETNQIPLDNNMPD